MFEIFDEHDGVLRQDTGNISITNENNLESGTNNYELG